MRHKRQKARNEASGRQVFMRKPSTFESTNRWEKMFHDDEDNVFPVEYCGDLLRVFYQVTTNAPGEDGDQAVGVWKQLVKAQGMIAQGSFKASSRRRGGSSGLSGRSAVAPAESLATG